MKIIDVAGFYSDRGGGVLRYINQKMEFGSAMGHEIVVVAPGPKDREESRCGGRVRWVKSHTFPFDPRYYMLLKRQTIYNILNQEEPDVVEISSPWACALLMAQWSVNTPKILVFHHDLNLSDKYC